MYTGINIDISDQSVMVFGLPNGKSGYEIAPVEATPELRGRINQYFVIQEPAISHISNFHPRVRAQLSGLGFTPFLELCFDENQEPDKWYNEWLDQNNVVWIPSIIISATQWKESIMYKRSKIKWK